MSFQIDKDYIIRIRRELHQIPEIGFDLPKTLAVVRRELDALGLPYTEEFGESSIVATLNEGVGNKTIGIRADMDALPVTEQTGLPFASTHPGKMHACGHDAHTAMLLGAAKALKAMEKDIKCCVKFVFQASEEGVSGANKMCQDGLMNTIDEIIGCHVVPGWEAGSVRLNKTCANACSHGLRINLTGKASHASTPQYGVDALTMAVRVYNAIQMIRTRELDPFEPTIINIGELHGGTANNIMAEDAYMTLTLRTLKNEVDEFLVRRITQIAESTAAEMGGKAEVISYKFTPCLVNDHMVADALLAAGQKVIGDLARCDKPISLGAEDFAYYALEKPGAMFNLGCLPEDGKTAALHNGKMMLNEDTFVVTPKVFVQYVLDRMEA